MLDVMAHDRARRQLEQLEQVLCVDDHRRIRARHVASSLWERVDRAPLLVRVIGPAASMPAYPVAQAVADPAKMLCNELECGFTPVLEWLTIRDDRPLQIRPNFGIGLVASAFGAIVEVVEDNPPWVHPLAQHHVLQAIRRVVDKSDPANSHHAGWIPRVDDTYEYYERTLKEFPNVANSVAVAIPDLQGPMDTAAMLWGSNIYEALHTAPELVTELLTVVGDTMLHLHQRFRARIGNELLPNGFSHQHGSVIRGGLLLRCDSNVMIGPEMYRQLVFPHDIRILKQIGGGSFHSCGRWQQNVPTVLQASEIGSLDFGHNQSHLNDVDTIYRDAQRHKKHLNLISVDPRHLRDRIVQQRFPTGATVVVDVDDLNEAVSLASEYRIRH